MSSSTGIPIREEPYSNSQMAEFDELLFDILTKFTGLIINDYKKEISRVLKQVTEYLNFDRGTLCEFVDDEDTLKVITFYAKTGIPSPANEKIGPALTEYAEEIKRGGIMMFSSFDEILERFKIEAKHATETQLKSNIGLPIQVGGKFLGALTFDTFNREVIWSRGLINKLNRLTKIFSNVLTREISYDRQQTVLRLEALISSISTKFLNIPPEKIDDEIENALKDIGKAVGIDRLTLWSVENTRAPEPEFILKHYWSRFQDEEKRLKYGMKGSHYPWLVKKMLKKEFFIFSHVDEIPENESVDRQGVMKIGTKSSLVIPLIFSNQVEGVLGFDSVLTERNWSSEIISSAKILAQIFTNILSRKRSDMNLQDAFKTIIQLKKQIESDYNYLKNEIEMEHDYHEIIGESAPLKNVLFKIDQVASIDTTVLILGETGTGKELVAQAIHNRSPRKDRPLVRVNCAALSPALVESELFGHEKGAFTGAHQKKKGRFEIAHGTSLFLDEIGELPLELQAKLLRVVQTGEFERIGSSRTRKVDVRIIAATNKNLDAEAKEGRFRQDLLYRLNVFPITVPPLRARLDDIPTLVNCFLQKFGKKLGKPINHISKESLAFLKEYPWKGNVRELENTIERAVINASGRGVEIWDISLLDEARQVFPGQKRASCTLGELELTIPKAPLPEMERHFKEMERDYIIEILEQTRWRIDGPKGAALILGLKPSTLRSRMEKLGILKASSLKP